MTKKSPFATTDPDEVYAGKYPLARFLYVYVNRAPGKPLDPLTEQFLRFVLSRDGQEIVLKDGYLPLKAGVVDQELAKLRCDAAGSASRASGRCPRQPPAFPLATSRLAARDRRPRWCARADSCRVSLVGISRSCWWKVAPLLPRARPVGAARAPGTLASRLLVDPSLRVASVARDGSVALGRRISSASGDARPRPSRRGRRAVTPGRSSVRR
jgi:hypothetical protein